jgi:WD40 repeat protein/energy-coupling factor transporter ATP-binding protein EcfA2
MSPNKNPFVGLRPFDSEDNLYYFGRNEHTEALLKNLYQSHFLAVVGASGSGKSSLVRAGLIPNLEAGFLVQDRDIWHIAKMKPGDQPLNNLANALLQAIGDKPSAEQVSNFAASISDGGIQTVLEKLAPSQAEDDSNLFLLVDQFEEVFRFGMSTGDRVKRNETADFVNLLLRLAGQRDISAYICLTMRSDYIGECDAFDGLPEAMNRSQYLVPRLTRQQRREAIEGPIRLSGTFIAPRLLDRLLNESGENRDELPVMQHALMRTWNEWAKEGNGPIDTVHYENIKTMKDALSQHANEAYDELSNEEKQLAIRLFQTMTEKDAENRRVRRAARLNEIADIIDASSETTMKVIQKFQEDSRSFLILSSEASTDNPLVDISHESLMRQWDKLRKWMDDEAESAKIYKKLAEAAEEKKQGKADLYTGAALQLALEWKEKGKPTPAWGKLYHKGFEYALTFLDESLTAHEKKERELEKQRKQRERLRQTRIFSIAVSVFLVIAVFLAYQAIKQSHKAELRTQDAYYNLTKAFEEKALSALGSAYGQSSSSDYKKAWLSTAAALKQGTGRSRLHLRPSSACALLDPGVVEAAFYEKWFSPPGVQTAEVYSVAFSPDGKTMASGLRDNTIHLWDVVTGKEIGKLAGHLERVAGITFSPTGNTIASCSWDNTIRLWDVESGKEIGKLTGHLNSVTSVAFSPDGRTIASGSWDRTIRLWDVESGEEIGELTGHSDIVKNIVFSPDGKTIASGSKDSTIRLWDVNSGREIGKLAGHSEPVTSVTFSPDGKTIASGSKDSTIRLWNVNSGREKCKLKGHSESVTCVTFSPGGKTIASGSHDKTIRLWDVLPCKKARKFPAHRDRVTSVALSPGGETIASGSYDNTIRLWDVVSGKETAKLTGHSITITSVAFSPDGKIIASGSYDNTIRLWDVVSGKETKKLIGHSSSISNVAFSLDGKSIASGSWDGTIRMWDVASGKEKIKLAGHIDQITNIAFCPDGKTIASSSGDTTIRLWNVASGKEIGILTGHEGWVYCVTFSPDGKTIASGSFDKTVRLWDVASGKETAKLTGHSKEVTDVVFFPDGKGIASASGDKTLRLWVVDSGKEIGKLTGHLGGVRSVVFSPDGNNLVSGSDDKTIRLWDMSIFNLFLKVGKPTPLFYAFSEGAEFFWGVELEGLEYKTKERCVSSYDKKFRPLLNPPTLGQTKFDQILEWAKKQQ